MSASLDQRSYHPAGHSGGGQGAGGSQSSNKVFSPNTQIHAQDAQVAVAYHLQEGTVRLFRETGLKRVVVTDVGPGTILGAAEFMGGGRFLFDAVAQDTVRAQVVSRGAFIKEFAALSATMKQVLKAQAQMMERLAQLADSPSVEQTFLGICRGMELLARDTQGPMPESQVSTRLRELFGLPSPIVTQVIRVLADLNLIKRTQKGPMEAEIEVVDPRLAQRAASLVDRWLPTLPSLLTKDLPRPPYTTEELAAELDVDEKTVLRRMLAPDFPTQIMRFDAEGVANIRQVYGDAFFKKKVSSKDLIADAQSIDDLLEVDTQMMREFIPHMDIQRLCQLLTRASEAVREHILKALSGRMRRVAEAEVAAMPPISDSLYADLERELMELAQGSLDGGRR